MISMPIRNHSFDLNSTTELVQSVSITGAILAVSPEWLRVMGYTLEEVLNKPFSLIVEKSTLEHLQKNFPHLTKYGFVNNIPFKLLTKEKKEIQVVLNGTSKFDKEGNFLYSYCEIKPISTFGDEMLLEYLEKERFYKNMIFLKNNIMKTLTEKHTIGSFLESLYFVLIEPVEVTDVIIEDKKNSDTSNFLICKELFENNNAQDTYNGFVLKESEFPKELTVSKNTAFLIFLKIADQSLKSNCRLIIIGVDSYKLVQHEWLETFISISQIIELAISNILIKQKDQQLLDQSRLAQMGEMISMIAHQWRQPISIIAMGANNLLVDIDLHEVSEENIIEESQSILKQTEYLSKTIDDFRNFYKPNKKLVSVKLEEVILKSLNIIKASLINNNIEIIEEYNSKEEIRLYDNEMMQVLLNILQNAQDNFEEKRTKDPYIKITTENSTISICDNGGGIPEDIIEKIFDPYFSTKDEKNGTGLGLYMSKTIVEEHHNGKLNVENTDDGACFIIELEIISEK